MATPRISKLNEKFGVRTHGGPVSIPEGHTLLESDDSTGMMVTIPQDNLEAYNSALGNSGSGKPNTMDIG